MTDSPLFPLLSPFDFDPRTRVVFGAGSMSQLGGIARQCGGGRVLLVTDGGLRDAGHEARALTILREAGYEVHVFDDVRPNPTTIDVEQGAEFAAPLKIELIIGLGGGSSMDCAKGINFLLTNGGRMQDYRGIGKATRPMLPLIAIPTTAGTGSEAQSFAVISDAETHMKMACGDRKAAARVAILDPELTMTMPSSVTATTGIDAISHAIESYVSTKRNPVSQLFSRQAWRLLSRAFPAVIKHPESLEARGAMLLGAHLAGSAIENSMLGATHALANPLSAHYGTTHGIAIGMMLSHVVRFNASAVPQLYTDLAIDAELCTHRTDPEAPRRLADYLDQLTQLAGLPTSLSTIIDSEEMLPNLAQEAAVQWTGNFNPRPVDAQSLEELYRCALT
ncbi:MAG: iron-containing alcohol dehydrogenase [Planctomycetaceae bacterium]